MASSWLTNAVRKSLSTGFDYDFIGNRQRRYPTNQETETIISLLHELKTPFDETSHRYLLQRLWVTMFPQKNWVSRTSVGGEYCVALSTEPSSEITDSSV